VRIQDRVAIGDLVARYAMHVDRREREAAAALFTDDGVLVAAEPPRSLGPVHEHRGPEAIAGSMAALDAIAVTAHELTGHVVDATGPDTATGRVACVAHHLTEHDGSVRDLVWHLHYQDEYSRSEDGWRFARRELHVDFIETRPVRQMRRPATSTQEA